MRDGLLAGVANPRIARPLVACVRGLATPIQERRRHDAMAGSW